MGPRFEGNSSGGRHEKWRARRSTFRTGERARERAVFIGINYENDVELKLSGCINDVHNAQKYLRNAGFNPGEVRVLTDNTTDDLPTRANIIDAMQWLVDGSAPGDVLWFHFSGHGEQVRDDSGDERDGKDEAIVPLDARQTKALIADDVINDILVKSLPRGVTLYAVFDCCHSGTIMDLAYCYDEIKNRMEEDEDRADDSGEGKVIMFSGCLNEQKSADLGADIFKGIKKSVGALSRNLYKRLEKGFTYGALIAEVRVGLRSSKLSQVPQLEANHELNPDELAFSKAFGKDRSAGISTDIPPARDASEVPIHVLEVYESKGKRVKGMDSYLNFARQKADLFSHIFSKNVRAARSYIGKLRGSSRGRSSSSTKSAGSSSTPSPRRRRSSGGRRSSRRSHNSGRGRRSRRDDYSSESYSDSYDYSY